MEDQTDTQLVYFISIEDQTDKQLIYFKSMEDQTDKQLVYFISMEDQTASLFYIYGRSNAFQCKVELLSSSLSFNQEFVKKDLVVWICNCSLCLGYIYIEYIPNDDQIRPIKHFVLENIYLNISNLQMYI